MTTNVEALLQEAALRYVKEVDEHGTRYSLRFETGMGPVAVSLGIAEDLFTCYVFVRDLESIPHTFKPAKDFFRELLRLNARFHLARVCVWVDPDAEFEWLVVAAHIPAAAITVDTLKWAVGETVELTGAIQTAISERSPTPHGQLEGR